MKRFEVDETSGSSGDTNKPPPATGNADQSALPWPGFDPRTLPQAEWPIPQVSPKVQQTVSTVIREAIDAGMSLHDTYASVAAILARHNVDISSDDLSGWVGSHALAVT